MTELSALVDALYVARRDGHRPDARAPEDLDKEAALGLQLAVLQRFRADGDDLAGWKVGLSTGKSHDALGPGFRPFGYIRASRCLASNAKIPMGKIVDCRVEPELCVILGSALKGGNVTPQEARAAVRAIAPAFEINEVRVGMAAQPSLFVADGLANWGVVVGEEVPVPPGEIETRVTLYRDGVLLNESPLDLPADGPFVALARLCNGMHRHGLGLEEGQKVITGAFSQDRVSGPAHYRADFAGIGMVEVHFS